MYLTTGTHNWSTRTICMSYNLILLLITSALFFNSFACNLILFDPVHSSSTGFNGCNNVAVRHYTAPYVPCARIEPVADNIWCTEGQFYQKWLKNDKRIFTKGRSIYCSLFVLKHFLELKYCVIYHYKLPYEYSTKQVAFIRPAASLFTTNHACKICQTASS